MRSSVCVVNWIYYPMDETWKVIPKTNGFYLVSNLGRIKSLKKNASTGGIILKLGLHPKGYLRIGITYDSGKRIMKSVARLVGMAFIPNPENKSQINHIDGVKTNNTVSNLEWVSNQENMDHSIQVLKNRNWDYVVGENCNFSQLTEEEVIQIPKLLETKSAREISKMFNVAPTTITEIVHGRSWKHLNLKFPELKDRKRRGNTKYPYIYPSKNGTYFWSMSVLIDGKRKYFGKYGFATPEEALIDLQANRLTINQPNSGKPKRKDVGNPELTER